MKKLLYLAAAFALSSMSLAAQEASAIETAAIGDAEPQNTIDFGVIGRFESNPQFSLEKGSGFSHNFANSCVYTNLEATFGEHWFINWVGHWVDNGGEAKLFSNTPNLYKNTWRSDQTWTDFLYVDYMNSGWRVRLGKDCQAMGGYEYDDWDWDCTYDLSSSFWNNNTSYRWGGSLFWTSPSENTTLQFQAISSYNLAPVESEEDADAGVDAGAGVDADSGVDASPWRPWTHGYGTYTVKQSGSYGAFTTSNSLGWMQYGPNGLGMFMGVVGFGGDVNDGLTIRGELMGRFGSGPAAGNGHSLKALAEVLWTPSDKIDVRFRGIVDRLGQPVEISQWIEEDPEEIPVANVVAFGGTFNWYPLNSGHDLRISASLTYNDTILPNNFASSSRIGATIGITYNHVFRLLAK